MQSETAQTGPHLHLISDSTGETLDALARAALAPFGERDKVTIHLSVFVRSGRDLDAALAKIRNHPGPVWFTVVDPKIRARIEAACAEMELASQGVLDPLIATLARFLGQAPNHRAGMQYQMNEGYFDRIAALDYAIAHDDGAQESGDTDSLARRLMGADVILTGISRTSKTPTCIYLAYRGIKAANVPLIPNQHPPDELFAAMKAGIPVIGLTASPARLTHVRSQRLETLGQAPRASEGPSGAGTSEYADLERIRAEVSDARLFFQRHDIPVIDVTRRSIEETAAELLALLRERDADS
ncbi:MAG: kinase/pyrophosphorylase [Paracoccaceae bacterium]|nr:kinase/pyrophosphorylase [Paracoccaceae bacterium]